MFELTNRIEMNENQIRLARHALGFDEKVKISYRNYFYVEGNTPSYKDWEDLRIKNLAQKTLVPTKDKRKYYMFSLTLDGARMALNPGESLDPEDFS